MMSSSNEDSNVVAPTSSVTEESATSVDDKLTIETESSMDQEASTATTTQDDDQEQLEKDDGSTTTSTAESTPNQPPSYPSLADDDSLFSQIVYLGASCVIDPTSEEQLLKLVNVLNNADDTSDDAGTAQTQHIEITLTVATHRDGVVRLLDTQNGSEVATFVMQRIRFVVRGKADSTERYCFAFSYVQHQGSSPEDAAVYQCHAFRCIVPEAVGRVLCCFASAFRTSRVQRQNQLTEGSSNSFDSSTAAVADANEFNFQAFLEMKEDDGKGGFATCPQEKSCFKLRRDREKRITFTIHQMAGPRVLIVQKCFGLLLAPGRNVRHSDMQLLDMHKMGRGNESKVYIIEAIWDPASPHFEVLNTETPRDTRVFLTVAADIVLLGIREPIRFTIECKARIFHQHERFWYITRRPVVEQYSLFIKKAKPAEHGEIGDYEMTSFESATQRDFKMKQRVSMGGSGRSPGKMAAQLIHPVDDDESDSDEPLLSGSGEVCREASEELLSEWAKVLQKWKADGDGVGVGERPKELNALIRQGIPDVLRGEVWQLLSGAANEPDMQDTYRMLIGKECPSEQVILRDIHRTFPAHDHFKESGGVGQEQLLKLSKAYALYDEQVGYCQGLSFMAASLLLHLPEEQAFCVLVKIMFDYGLRDLFKPGFDALLVRFYQLERLIEDYIPDLGAHFADIHVEAHMFASQWFLTLFTAKFPLSMVYHIIDLFLSEGMNTIFHISLALLRSSKKELLQLDFEGVLKYFRVVLPRKYRGEQAAKELIREAVKLKMSHKRLAKYEKEYRAWKQQEADTLDPVERLEREKLTLKETILRLERENDDLAHELVTSKIELRSDLDAAEDNVESLRGQVEHLTRTNAELTDENKHLHDEYNQVRDMCRKEMERLEENNKRQHGIITNYKQICSDLSHRLEKQQASHDEEKKALLRRMSTCAECSQREGTANNGVLSSPTSDSADGGHPLDESGQIEEYKQTIRTLEVKLAECKLAFVETKCENQELTRQLNQTTLELETLAAGKNNTWLKKTITSLNTMKDSASAALRQPEATASGSMGSVMPRKDSSGSERTGRGSNG